MFHRFCFCLCLWRLDGVFGDEMKLVSEGDSVTLNSNLTEIHDDLIQWSFLVENTLIAEINVTADRFSVYEDVLGGRFRDRLKLDNQTGSLTITNFTKEQTGFYTVETKNMTIFFFLAVYDEISVKKGDSVTLNSDLTEIDYDLIQWTYLYMSEKAFIAGILKPTNRMTVNEDALDGRFRDRLKLDNQTGSLTITNIRNEHTGDYELLIIGAKQSLKVFSVSVYDSVHCCGSTEAVIRLVLSALVGVATVIFLVYDIRSRRAEQDQAQIHTPRESVCHGQLKSTEFFSEQDSNPGHQHGRVMGPSPPCRGLVLLDPLQARSEPGSLGWEEGTLTRTLSTAAASINSYKQASDTL